MAVDKKHREEQDLERYGVWVKAGPDEFNEQDSTSLELMDIEDSDHEELLITEEEEKLLGELEEASLPDFGDFDESFDTDLSDESFGDLDDPSEIPSEKLFESDTESKVLLHKIEVELNALRDEIRQLKDELTGLRVPSVSASQDDSGESGGFFEEEEDETIALTGDELDNILDSADLTEETADDELIDVSEDNISGDISFDEEETIDLSDDFTELSIDDVDDFEIEEIEDDSDPALSILGSPDEPDLEGDPETIEIDIPGMDEVVDLGDMEDVPLVNIDDIDNLSDESIDLDDFEEVTDLEDFGLNGTETSTMPLMEEAVEEIMPAPIEEAVIAESFDDEVFDEGEEVVIDLTEVDDDLEVIDDTEILDIEMEEISLDDFGIENDENVEENSDVLAILDDDQSAEINLLTDLGEDKFEIVEDLNLDSVLAESIDAEESLEDISLDDIEEIGGIEEINPPSADDDIEELVEDLEDLEELGDIEEMEPLSDDDGIEELVEDLGTEVDLETIEDIEIDEIDLAVPSTEDESPEEILLDEIEPEDISETDDFEELEDLEEFEDIPEISLDTAIDEMESVEEFSIEDSDDEIEIIEELDMDLEDEDGSIQVTLPDDDFNELPGTEEVDLESLEALAAAPDLTEEAEEDFIELPEIEEEELGDLEISEPEETPVSSVEGIKEKTRAALEKSTISDLPGDLQDEIKDVLKYMDQLLESLPDDKIQEFARSEHFEVYKKIFEELGISD